jgi:hypothetical protein
LLLLPDALEVLAPLLRPERVTLLERTAVPLELPLEVLVPPLWRTVVLPLVALLLVEVLVPLP